MCNQLNEIESNIKRVLEEYDTFYTSESKNRKISSSEQTWDIKKRIGVCGKEKGFEVRASEFEGEWLYDMVWMKRNEITKQLKSVELVLEMEWGHHYNDRLNDIKYDFEKLLSANSEIRIMICCMGNDLTSDKIKEYCDKAVETYENLEKGARVLTLIWDDCGEEEGGVIKQHLSIKK